MEIIFSKHWKRHFKWKVLFFSISLLLLLPILALPFKFLSADFELLNVFNPDTFPTYLINSLIIVIGVTILTCLFSIPSAWLVSCSVFPFSKQFEWLLILPMSIPTFICGIAYVGLTDYTGIIRTFFRNSMMAQDVHLDIMNIYGVIVVMSLVLYPYSYLTARIAFKFQSGMLIEVGKTLGAGIGKIFFKLVLPVAWPLIFSGLSLIIMEVLNDYGTVNYFGVPTFTTGIFKSWFSLGNLQEAIFLSIILILFVLFVLIIEDFIRGNKKFYDENLNATYNKKQLFGWKKWIAFSSCFGLFFFSFLLPVFQLFIWLIEVWDSFLWGNFFEICFNSFWLSFLSSILIVILSFLLAFSIMLAKPSKTLFYFFKTSILGYATPGAVIAIGIIVFLLSIFPSLIYISFVPLIFGYFVRFFAVGYNPLENSLKKLPDNLHEVSFSLGRSSWDLMIKIILPLIRPGIFIAIIMVFVDISKELSLTLILRPFNFETLATNAFQYAKDEQATQSAPSSLLIIALGLVPTYILNKMFNLKANASTGN